MVGGSGPTSYQVRLLGDDAVTEVHWKKMCRLVGPDLQSDEEVVASALHDRQRFNVERFDDWIVDSDGDTILLVRWKHHTEQERTWEPLQQLVEDVPALVTAYVNAQADERLGAAYEEAKAAVAAVANE